MGARPLSPHPLLEDFTALQPKTLAAATLCSGLKCELEAGSLRWLAQSVRLHSRGERASAPTGFWNLGAF